MTVGSGPLEIRKKWMALLFDSGVVELDNEGREVVTIPNKNRKKAVSEHP